MAERLTWIKGRIKYFMLRKTSILFREDVKEGYKHYQYFIRHWTMVFAIFEKTMCPVPVDTSIDVNSDLIRIGFDTTDDDFDSYNVMWDELTLFLKEEGFRYTGSKKEWAVYIHIDNFVETVLSKPELYRWDGKDNG